MADDNKWFEPTSPKAVVARQSPPIPALRDVTRKVEITRTFNDDIDDIVQILMQPTNDPNRLPREERELDFADYIEGVVDSDTIEGSQGADNLEAARLIREWAQNDEQHRYPRVARANKTTIVKALNVVLNRMGLSRKTRRNMIGGVVVNTGSSDNNDQ